MSMSDSEENVYRYEGYPEEYERYSTEEEEENDYNPVSIQNEVKIKFFKEPEKLEVEEIEILRSHFIRWAGMFYDKRIHAEDLIEKIQGTEKTAKGLKTMLDILLENSIDPM